MSTRLRLTPAIVVALLLAGASRASADVTAFLGYTPTGTGRAARGFAVGFGVLIVGFEFEYADVREVRNADSEGPSLRTGMFNGLVQTPFPIAGMQFYATAGGGIYRERLDVTQQTNVAVNTGGGVKITLAGPLRIRLDYRVFKLNGSALPAYSRPQRFYAGINLTF